MFIVISYFLFSHALKIDSYFFLFHCYIILDTPDAVNLLLRQLKKNTTMNMDSQGECLLLTLLLRRALFNRM